MKSERDRSVSREDKLQAILHMYLQAVDAGQLPDRTALLRQHPEFASELEAFFADERRLARLAPAPTADNRPTLAPMPTTPPASGTTVRYFGDYELLEEIARGGMDVVYKARQVSLNRIVAVKMILAGQLASEEDVQRFQAEARLAANLQHPHIVAIHEVGEYEGQHYFSMDYVEGQSLADMVRENPLPPRDAVRYVKTAAEAIHFAHQHGTLHRDLKPSNILIDRFDQPRVTDFGLAKRIGGDAKLTVTGAVIGTPSYMPPEQASADRGLVTAVSDVYSLGAVLYELVTGRPPFRAATPMDTLLQVLADEPAAPRLLNPAIGRDLETILLKCLAKEPARRYGSAQDLADDLQAFLDGRPITARRPSLPERAVRWVQHNRRVTAVIALTAVASLLLWAGGSLGWNHYRESQLGRVSLTTQGPNLLAEVLDENEGTVLASFPVPTPQPVALPAGSHRLRLSASGLLSETWPLHIERGGGHSHPVRLRHQWIWPPKEVSQGQLWEILDLPWHADLVVIDAAIRSVRRIDGATGKQQFEVQLHDDIPAEGDQQEWLNLLNWAQSGNVRVVQPACDLNGDELPDLVIQCRTSSSLLALNGEDGSRLWWFRGRPPLPEGVDPAKVQYKWPNPSCCIGRPALADVDGDGTADVIACFLSQGEAVAAGPNQGSMTGPGGWIEAVSGKTGKSLWQYRVKPELLTWPNDSNLMQRYEQTCRPQVVRLNGRPVVVMAAGWVLLGLDLKTGKEVWPPLELGRQLLREPHFLDLDGDGQPDCLSVGQHDEDGSALVLRAVSLATRKTLWEDGFRPAYRHGHSMAQADALLHLVADLNGDGWPEIVRTVKHDPGWTRGRWSGIEMLDGRTGTRRWLRRLTVTEYVPPDISRYVLGPDLDGDGWREVFVSWVSYVGDSQRDGLQVAALSGADGRTLWHWCRVGGAESSPDPSGPLRWWQVGPDGWPMLLVPLYRGAGGQPLTFVLSGGTGRLLHTLPEVINPQVADFNGDGIPDLYYTVSPQGAPRLLVLQGMPPEPWKQLGPWRPGQDFDGDGYTDLLHRSGNWQNPTLAARSGRDGQSLWATQVRRPLGGSREQHDLFPPLPQGDLDGDGIADVIRLEDHTPGGTGQNPAVAAYSGRDGHRLWNAVPVGMTTASRSSSGNWGSYRTPFLDWCDLDGDGRAEVCVVHAVAPPGLRLSVFSGQDGRLLWQTPLATHGFALHGHPGPTGLADLDGDGVLDLVLWMAKDDAQESGRVGELRALSGRDGRVLWSVNPLTPPNDYLVWLRVPLGDLDGDGVPEAIVTTRREVLALDGRTGQRKWAWSSEMMVNEGPHTLLVDLDGNGRRAVCLRVFGQDRQQQIVLLNGAGQERARIGVGKESLHWLHGWWRHQDVDGDGKEELFFAHDGHLWASRGSEQEALWKWRLPSGNLGDGAIMDFLSGGKGEPAVVVVWLEKTVYGLDGKTGRPRWRCEVPHRYTTFSSPGPQLHVLAAKDSPAPRVLCRWPSTGADDLGTAVRQAWPTDADGRYQPPAPEPRTYPELDEMPTRALPWSYGLPRYFKWLAWVLIGYLVYLGWCRRWYRLGILVFIVVLVSAALAAAFLMLDYSESDEHYAWSGWDLIAMPGMSLVLGVLVMWTAGKWLFCGLRRLVRGIAGGVQA